MSTRKSAFLVGAFAAMLIFTVGTANAQTSTFGVQATATTGGYTGTGPDGPYTSTLSVSALSNPEPLEFNNGYGLVYADAGAAADANVGHLHVATDALAERRTATAFGNSRPSGTAETRYWDYFVIRSNSLPVGTAVDLVFRNAVILTWQASSRYSGSAYAELRVGGYSSSTQWWLNYYSTPVAFVSPEVRVKAKVGDRLSVSSKLRSWSEAYYYLGGAFNGSVSIDATSELEMDAGAQDVWLDFDSDH